MWRRENLWNFPRLFFQFQFSFSWRNKDKKWKRLQFSSLFLVWSVQKNTQGFTQRYERENKKCLKMRISSCQQYLYISNPLPAPLKEGRKDGRRRNKSVYKAKKREDAFHSPAPFSWINSHLLSFLLRLWWPRLDIAFDHEDWRSEACVSTIDIILDTSLPQQKHWTWKPWRKCTSAGVSSYIFISHLEQTCHFSVNSLTHARPNINKWHGHCTLPSSSGKNIETWRTTYLFLTIYNLAGEDKLITLLIMIMILFWNRSI